MLVPSGPVLIKVMSQSHSCSLHACVAVQVSSMDVGVDILVLAAKAFALKEKLWDGKVCS